MNFQGRRYKDGEVIYSEWFSRGGDNAIVRGETVDSLTDEVITVTITFSTKDPDEITNPNGVVVKDASNSEFQLVLSNTGSGVSHEVVVSGEDTTGGGFMEMVRLKATVSGNSTDDWLLGRLFPIVWFGQAVPMTAP